MKIIIKKYKNTAIFNVIFIQWCIRRKLIKILFKSI